MARRLSRSRMTSVKGRGRRGTRRNFGFNKPGWDNRKDESKFEDGDSKPKFNNNQGNGNGAPFRNFQGGQFCQSCVVRDNNGRVIYGGAWTLQNSGRFMTTHTTIGNGSTASLSFKGSGIVVFGTVSPSNSSSYPPTASFTLDAAAPFVTTQPFADSVVENQPLFFAMDIPDNFTHEIIVNVTKVNALSPFVLNSFFVYPPKNETDGEAPVLPFPPDPSSSLPNIPSQSQSTTTNSPSNQAVAQSTPDSVSVIRILAIFLGFFILLIIGLVTFLCIHIRRSRRRGTSSGTTARAKVRSRSWVSHQGTFLTTTESIMRNISPSVLWSRRDDPPSEYPPSSPATMSSSNGLLTRPEKAYSEYSR